MDRSTFTKNAIRHGEVLLIPVDEMPENVEQIYKGSRFIVGHSETGHHHVAVGTRQDSLIAFKPVGADTNDLYLKVATKSKLEHLKTFDKHETKTLNPGVYLVRPKSEYDPFAKIIRKVRD